MEKLTSILAVVEELEPGGFVLEKTVRLARLFGAHVELLIADDSQLSAFASRCATLDYDNLILFSAHRGGDPLHEIIDRRVAARCPDLVIKAPSGSHPLRRWALSANDWQLACECPVPVMLAGAGSWREPVRFAAAVDVADEGAVRFARSILHTAGFLALGCRGRLDVLYSEREQRDETLRMQRAVTLAQLVRENHIGTERLRMFNGAPEARLTPLIAAREYDVLVLGAISHRTGLASSLESLSSKFADASKGDVVLVKPDQRELATANPKSRSRLEQRLYEREQFV
jgi:universal stress protein E